MPGRRDDDVWAVWDRRIRDTSIFIFGALGFFHELLIREPPNIYMIIASGALMGVPMILSADKMKGGPKDG